MAPLVLLAASTIWMAWAPPVAGAPSAASVKRSSQEETPDFVYEVEVRGKRDLPGTGRADAVGFATVLNPGEHRHRAVTLPDLLRHAVGVDVKGFGGLGGFATVSIRGSSSEQVQIFLDGVPLNRAASGILNLADVPLAELERIEVYRGLTPARFGAAGPGGVVNLVTRSGSPRPRTTFSAGYGSFHTFEFGLSHGGPHDRGDVLVLAHGQRSEGNFLFLDNNGTPLNPTDDETTRRRNNAFFSAGGLLKTTVRLPQNSLLRVTAEGFARDQGVPGIDALQSERATASSARILGKIDWERRDLWPGAHLSVSAFATHARDAFDDGRGELGLGPRLVRTSTWTPGVSSRLAAALGASHLVSALAEWRYDLGGSSALALGRWVETAVARHAIAFAVEDQISLWRGRLLFNPSFRLDALVNRFEGPVSQDASNVQVAGKLGLRWFIADGLSLRGSAGRFFRPPTLVELFGDTGLIRGNPRLRPEIGHTFDGGLTFERRTAGIVRRLFAEAVYFESRYDDLIVFQLNGQGVAIAENQSAATIRGAEISAALELAPGLDVSLAYTFQRAVSDAPDRANGKLLPGRPQHKLSARAALTRGDWRLFYELLVIDGNFIDRLNHLELDARVLHAAGVAWRALPALTVAAEVQNFTDNRAVDLYRFPLPGRSFFAKLAADL